MKFNWYRIIGTSCMALNFFGQACQVNNTVRNFTGVGVEYVNPVLGTTATIGAWTAQPTAKIIETATNTYWRCNADIEKYGLLKIDGSRFTITEVDNGLEGSYDLVKVIKNHYY